VIWATWDRPQFLGKLQGRLSDKDSKVLKGGPYDEYTVLVHTDEPALTADIVEQWLSDYLFAKPTQIHRAYLLLSYDPRRRGYPYFRLGWREAQNWLLQLSRAMSKVAIAFRRLKGKSKGALSRAFWSTACS
jgi:hypothetical protein